MSNHTEHNENDETETDEEAEFLREYENSCQLDEFGQMFYHIISRLRTIPKTNGSMRYDNSIRSRNNEGYQNQGVETMLINSTEGSMDSTKCEEVPDVQNQNTTDKNHNSSRNNDEKQKNSDYNSSHQMSLDLLRPMCRFHVLGKCKFGESCTFSHDLSSCRNNQNTNADSINPYLLKTPAVICPYFVRGYCRYENRCHLSHDKNDMNNQKEEKTSEYACGICFEDIITTGKRFGLLTCDHCFCLDCIREWRRSKSLQSNVTRSCPACRQTTDFVVPSRTFYIGKEKQTVIETYKNELSKKPCRYFNGTIGSCSLGLHCFYAHIHDGKDMKQLERKMTNEREKEIDVVYRLIEELNLFDNGF